MLPATPEADELQQLPLELPRYLLVALRESGGHRAYALLPPYAQERNSPMPMGGDNGLTRAKKKALAQDCVFFPNPLHLKLLNRREWVGGLRVSGFNHCLGSGLGKKRNPAPLTGPRL